MIFLNGALFITISLGDTIVCDELVKAIEGVTTNGKTKLQQG